MDKSRREFIKASMAGAMIVSAGSVVNAVAAPQSKSEVYVGKGDAAKMIPRIIKKMGGMGRFVKPGSRVIIKPNMSFTNDATWGNITTPEAVRAVAELCISAGAKRIIICDNTLRDAEICKEKTGIPDAVKDLKQVVVFTPKEESLFEDKTDPKAKTLTSTKVVKEVLRADSVISLPCAKSHGSGGVSLGIKGLMGLVYDRGIMHSGMDLAMAIAEQLYYIKPTLTIVDATRALLDNGPSGPGKVVELNTFVAGVDPVAVDSFAVSLASWYGRQFEGKQVAHIKNAADLGFGNVESGMITQVAV